MILQEKTVLLDSFMNKEIKKPEGEFKLLSKDDFINVKKRLEVFLLSDKYKEIHTHLLSYKKNLDLEQFISYNSEKFRKGKGKNRCFFF